MEALGPAESLFALQADTWMIFFMISPLTLSRYLMLYLLDYATAPISLPSIAFWCCRDQSSGLIRTSSVASLIADWHCVPHYLNGEPPTPYHSFSDLLCRPTLYAW